MHKVADILNHVHAILVGSNDADQAETFLRNLLDGLDLDTLRHDHRKAAEPLRLP